MSGFKGFSDASKLYGEFQPIVDEVYDTFEREMDDFLAAVDAGVKAAFLPELVESSKAEYQSWWFAESVLPKHQRVFVYCKRYLGSVPFRSALALGVSLPAGAAVDNARILRLTAVTDKYVPSAKVVSKHGKRMDLFVVEFPLDTSDMVESATECVVRVLRDVRDVA